MNHSLKATDHWLWQKQLRFYNYGENTKIKMVDAEFLYTFEYQGIKTLLMLSFSQILYEIKEK